MQKLVWRGIGVVVIVVVESGRVGVGSASGSGWRRVGVCVAVGSCLVVSGRVELGRCRVGVSVRGRVTVGAGSVSHVTNPLF